MKIISFIEEIEIIEIILQHLGLWDIRNPDPPQPDQVYIPEFKNGRLWVLNWTALFYLRGKNHPSR